MIPASLLVDSLFNDATFTWHFFVAVAGLIICIVSLNVNEIMNNRRQRADPEEQTTLLDSNQEESTIVSDNDINRTAEKSL